ncbi:major facilitator superfamily domain-containing protein [Lentinula lateritia]|uniref:Major facilitator superfamily domain-containing protein n=1 Tax=Lentinula lateritia TaxID=40482 RepID=A0ABQ8VSG9_9AGAR|nr:major facilitator superfamily domain-containing protein [Lentinula lateritia]
MSNASGNNSESIQLAMQTPLPASSLNPSSLSVNAVLPSDGFSSIDSIPSINRNQSFLPPVDKGFGAWSFLAAAFVVEAIVWGFPTSFGVFLDVYLKDTKYTAQPKASSLLPLIGPVSSGIIYCSGPFITPVITRYPYHKRTFMYVGTILCWASLFAASYTTQIIPLVVLQGALYAIGGSMLYIPCISFHRKRGFANGVVSAGTAVGGILLPLILPPLLSSYGPTKTLRILSIAIALLLVPLLPLIKGRLPESRIRAMGPTPLVANTLQGFGYFVPIVWLPTFASALNLNSSTVSMALALLNCGSVIGRLTTGYLSDKINPWILGLSTLASTSAATFILWGVLSYNLAGLLSFSVAYGILAGGWSSTWNGFTKPLSANDPNLFTTLYGILLFSRGLGNIFSTPISSALTNLDSNSTISSTTSIHAFNRSEHLGFNVGGGKFGKMIVYVGTCFAAAALIALVGWGMDVARRRRSFERQAGQEQQS